MTNQTHNNHWLTITIALTLILSPFTSIVLAADDAASGPKTDRPEHKQRQGKRQGQGQQQRLELRRILQSLDLTDEQKQQVRPAMKQAHEERQAWQQDNKENIKNLRKQIQQAKKDGNEELVKSNAGQLKNLMQQAPTPADKLKPILTAEQNTKLDAYIADQQAKRKDNRQQRKGNADGQRHKRQGEPGQRGPQQGRHQTMRRVLSQLDLTDDQKQQLREIRETSQPQMQAWRETNEDQLKQLRAEMKNAIQNKDRQTAENIREQMKSLMDSAPNPLDKIKGVLTAEQNEKAEQLLEQARQKRKEMHKQKGNRGEGKGEGKRKGKNKSAAQE